MGRFRLEVPLAIQIGAVVVLFAAALGTLWYTSSKVVEREERRARANDRLKEASDQLEARGKDALAAVRQFPDFMEAGDWSALDRKLSEEAGRIRGRYPGVEGGYYVPSRREQPFLPALPNEPRQSDAREGARLPVPSHRHHPRGGTSTTTSTPRLTRPTARGTSSRWSRTSPLTRSPSGPPRFA